MAKWTQARRWVLLAVLFGATRGFTEQQRAEALLVVQKELGVPSQIARVTDASWPHSTATNVKPDFILIQDVHRNPGVQSRIASLILHGYQHWGVRKVFMEGAFTPLDLSLFHRIPKNLLPDLVRRLVKDGDLSGAEVAAVRIMEKEWRNPPVSPFQLFGMEDPTLYRQNVLAYQSVVRKRDQALYDIASLRQKYLLLDAPEYGSGVQGLALMEKFLRLKVTPKEHEVFLMYQGAAPSTPDIDSAVGAAIEYYRLARMRSTTFLHEAARKAPASGAPRILVVGGFHTDDMAAHLRKQNRSFVVLSPVVVSSKGDSVYEQRMQETVMTVTDTLFPPLR